MVNREILKQTFPRNSFFWAESLSFIQFFSLSPGLSIKSRRDTNYSNRYINSYKSFELETKKKLGIANFNDNLISLKITKKR